MQLSQKLKNFYQSLKAFFKSRSNFEHVQKKMTLIANVVLKLQTPKNAVR